MLSRKQIDKVIKMRQEGITWESIANIEKVSAATLVRDIKKAGRYEEVKVKEVKKRSRNKPNVKANVFIKNIDEFFEKYVGYDADMVIGLANSRFQLGLDEVEKKYRKWRRAWVSSYGGIKI